MGKSWGIRGVGDVKVYLGQAGSVGTQGPEGVWGIGGS